MVTKQKEKELAYKKSWTYTLERIAELSGNSIHTVRDHKQSGMLNPDDLLSVTDYIHASRGVNCMRVEKEIFGGVDEYGNPIRA